MYQETQICLELNLIHKKTTFVRQEHSGLGWKQIFGEEGVSLYFSNNERHDKGEDTDTEGLL